MSRRHDIQDGTGRIEYLAGRGTLQAWGNGGPTNAIIGFAPACTWQDLANGKVYINIGSFTSSLWVEDDGGPGSAVVFGSAGNITSSSAQMLASGNIFRNVLGTAISPSATGADKILAAFNL